MSEFKLLYNVEDEVTEKAIRVAKKNGWTLLNIRKFDDNPANSYLSFVLCQRESGDYCTHLFNHSSGDGYFVYGHYDFKTQEEADKDLAKRK